MPANPQSTININFSFVILHWNQIFMLSNSLSYLRCVAHHCTNTSAAKLCWKFPLQQLQFRAKKRALNLHQWKTCESHMTVTLHICEGICVWRCSNCLRMSGILFCCNDNYALCKTVTHTLKWKSICNFDFLNLMFKETRKLRAFKIVATKGENTGSLQFANVIQT